MMGEDTSIFFVKFYYLVFSYTLHMDMVYYTYDHNL